MGSLRRIFDSFKFTLLAASFLTGFTAWMGGSATASAQWYYQQATPRGGSGSGAVQDHHSPQSFEPRGRQEPTAQRPALPQRLVNFQDSSSGSSSVRQVGYYEPYQNPQDPTVDPLKDLRGGNRQMPGQIPDVAPDTFPADDVVQPPEQIVEQQDDDPFSDDRAIKDLRQLLPTQPRQIPREIPEQKNGDAARSTPPTDLRRRAPGDEDAILQWETVPGMTPPVDRQHGRPPSIIETLPFAQPGNNIPAERQQPPRQPLNNWQGHNIPPQADMPHSWPDQAPSDYGALGNAEHGHAGATPIQARPFHSGGVGMPPPGTDSYFFHGSNDPWGVAGIEEIGYEFNGCSMGDCGFDCDPTAFYLTSYGGSVDLRNLVSGSNTLVTDNGGGFGFALGQRQGRNLRTEIEYGWRSNSIVGLETAAGLESLTGRVRSQAGMANAWWEFINFPHEKFKPYIGAGLGFARLDADLNATAGMGLTNQSSRDSSYAYQFMGGVSYKPTLELDLFIEYRLFNADAFQIETPNGLGDGRYEYRTHNLMGGLRWKF